MSHVQVEDKPSGARCWKSALRADGKSMPSELAIDTASRPRAHGRGLRPLDPNLDAPRLTEAHDRWDGPSLARAPAAPRKRSSPARFGSEGTVANSPGRGRQEPRRPRPWPAPRSRWAFARVECQWLPRGLSPQRPAATWTRTPLSATSCFSDRLKVRTNALEAPMPAEAPATSAKPLLTFCLLISPSTSVNVAIGD